MLDILIDLLTPVFVSMGASAADVANYVRAAGGYVYAILGILAAVAAVMIAAQFAVKKGTRHVVRWSAALAGLLAVVLVVNLVCFGPMYAMVSGVLNACTYIGSALSTYVFALAAQRFGWRVTVLCWAGVCVLGAAACTLGGLRCRRMLAGLKKGME